MGIKSEQPRHAEAEALDSDPAFRVTMVVDASFWEGAGDPRREPRSKFLLVEYRVEERPTAAKLTGRFSHVWGRSGPDR